MPILSALLLIFAPPALPVAPTDAATLIVYRAYAEPILFAPTLSVDGKAYGKLGQKRLLAFALSPGRHRLSIEWPPYAAQRGSDLDIVARPGARAFVELRAEAGAMRRKGVSTLIEQDPATGSAAMLCCHPPR